VTPIPQFKLQPLLGFAQTHIEISTKLLNR